MIARRKERVPGPVVFYSMMRTVYCSVLVAVTALTACTQTRVADQRNRRMNYNSRVDSQITRRTITGSNIPQPVNRPTFGPTSANQPLESFSRDRPGLTPTEPVVGAGNRSLYRLNEPATGAGPAGSNPLPPDDQPE